MANPYLPPKDENPEKVRTSVRLAKGVQDDLEAIARLWNRIDKELGRKRRVRWKPANLIEFFVTVGVAEFWRSVGGPQGPKESEDALLKRVVAAAKQQDAENSRS